MRALQLTPQQSFAAEVIQQKLRTSKLVSAARHQSQLDLPLPSLARMLD
jgi:hypothetical protein